MKFLEELFYEKLLDTEVHIKNLPHWEQTNKLQFITFRLGDSLPQEAINNYEAIKEMWLRKHHGILDEKATKELRNLISQKVEQLLDNGYGSCALRKKEVADIVENTMLHSDGEKYRLHIYVIMGNHIHVLLEMYENYKVANVIRTWKSVSAVQINKFLGKEGPFWQTDYYDRMIRNERHYHNVINYIFDNYMSTNQKARIGGLICHDEHFMTF